MPISSIEMLAKRQRISLSLEQSLSNNGRRGPIQQEERCEIICQLNDFIDTAPSYLLSNDCAFSISANDNESPNLILWSNIQLSESSPILKSLQNFESSLDDSLIKSFYYAPSGEVICNLSTTYGVINRFAITSSDVIPHRNVSLTLRGDGEIVTSMLALGSEYTIIGTSFGRVIVTHFINSTNINTVPSIYTLQREKRTFYGILKATLTNLIPVSASVYDATVIQNIFLLTSSPPSSADPSKGATIILTVGNTIAFWYGWQRSGGSDEASQAYDARGEILADLATLHPALCHYFDIIGSVIIDPYTNTTSGEAKVRNLNDSVYTLRAESGDSLLLAVLSTVRDGTALSVGSEDDIHTYLWVHILEFQSFEEGAGRATMRVRNRFCVSHSLPKDSAYPPRLLVSSDAHLYVIWSDDMGGDKCNAASEAGEGDCTIKIVKLHTTDLSRIMNLTQVERYAGDGTASPVDLVVEAYEVYDTCIRDQTVIDTAVVSRDGVGLLQFLSQGKS